MGLAGPQSPTDTRPLQGPSQQDPRGHREGLAVGSALARAPPQVLNLMGEPWTRRRDTAGWRAAATCRPKGAQRCINEPRVYVCVSLRGERKHSMCRQHAANVGHGTQTCSPYPCDRCVTVGLPACPSYLPHHGSPARDAPPACAQPPLRRPSLSVTGRDSPDGSKGTGRTQPCAIWNEWVVHADTGDTGQGAEVCVLGGHVCLSVCVSEPGVGARQV